METEVLPGGEPGLVDFLNFLRGMETYPTAPRRGRSTPLPKLP